MLNILQKTLGTTTQYERGLEMVPLLIHLPPASEDIEGNGRDTRDVTDESVSKAQIIYNIIASTAETSMKNRWHGQRHFSFEIIGTKGFVHLYVAVPLDMIDVLKQAVTSAYPSARLEEVAEHNIFNEVGGSTAVVGGRMNLKDKYAYPIATYQDLKRDAMQAILNALSGLTEEDGVAIQLLFRPADDSWRKEASNLAKQKREGKKNGLSVGTLAKDVMTAFVKAPEAKDAADKKKDLSSLEQSVIDAIEDKTRYSGFEVTIRLVASSNILQRAQSIINSVVASFSLFDAPGRNGFKFKPTSDVDKLINNYILRVFPPTNEKNILNSVELATLFHFPDQKSTPTSQLERQDSKQVDGPRNMPDEGLLLGFNVFRGVKKPIRLGKGDRQRHVYAVGQTGTGKSTFLENLALQDMLAGNGFAFVDPHGDTAERLLSMVPKERTEDVIYFCPSEMDYPMGMNLFEYQTEDQKDFLIQEVLNMLYKLYDPQHQGIMGPRYEDMFRNAALVVMADPDGGTFVDIPNLFRDPQFLKEKLQHVKDQTVLDFWTKQFPASQRSNEAGEVTAWFVSKFGAFLSNEMMRNIIGQSKSAFNLRDIMDNKKILLVNLSKGRTGELNSKLLGMMFVMKFQAAAMSRATILENDRVDFALYVDEFQNFSTDSFATILSEARKFRLNLIVANQFTTQLTDEIRDAVFGNIGTIVAFRIGQNDVEALTRYFQPSFDGDDLLRIPNFNAVARTLISGVPTQPFSMATLSPLGEPKAGLSDALKQLSAAKYGRPKAVVEKEIFARLRSKTPAMPNAAPGAMGAPQSPPLPKQGSFLDEWLSKQQARSAQPPQPPLAPSTQPTPPFAQPLETPPSPLGMHQPPNVNLPSSGVVPDGNVSSGAIDQQEVSSIAAELKKDLGSEQVSPAASPPKHAEGSIDLRRPAKDGLAPDTTDTIAIDNDGTFRGVDVADPQA
ncbi:MAG: ATP-binding protein [Candidatus Saccharimonadales bacterium]